jgi:hypothetical protein
VSHKRIFLLRRGREMRDLNPRLGRLCFLKLDMLKDRRDAVREETGPISGKDQKIAQCKARARTLEER